MKTPVLKCIANAVLTVCNWTNITTAKWEQIRPAYIHTYMQTHIRTYTIIKIICWSVKIHSAQTVWNIIEFSLKLFPFCFVWNIKKPWIGLLEFLTTMEEKMWCYGKIPGKKLIVLFVQWKWIYKCRLYIWS